MIFDASSCFPIVACQIRQQPKRSLITDLCIFLHVYACGVNWVSLSIVRRQAKARPSGSDNHSPRAFWFAGFPETLEAALRALKVAKLRRGDGFAGCCRSYSAISCISDNAAAKRASLTLARSREGLASELRRMGEVSCERRALAAMAGCRWTSLEWCACKQLSKQMQAGSLRRTATSAEEKRDRRHERHYGSLQI